MTVRTRAQIAADLLVNVPDNTSEQVTPAMVRSVLTNISDSLVNSQDDVGTSANKVVKLDGTAKLPAVDGSQLTNLAGAGATIIDTSGGAQSVTFDGTANIVKRYKHIGVNNLTINAGVGQTFEGGGSSIVSNASGDTVVLLLSGTVIYIISAG